MEGGTVDTIDNVDDVLAHFGVKGMRWGHRKTETPRQQSFRAAAKAKKAEKKEAKADSKWEKSIYTTKGAIAVHNNVADQMNSEILPRLNGKSKYKDKNLYDDPKLEKEYFKEYEKLTDQAYSKAITAVHGSSPSGKKTATYVNDAEGARIVITDSTVKHADSDEPDLVFLLKLDARGLVSEMNEAEKQIEHADNVDNFLMHYGVKGMRWGVRRSAAERAAPSAVKTTNKAAIRGSQDIKVKAKAGRGVVATKGGKRNVATSDAISAAAARQKAKASTTDALSNKELKAANERMNLEIQFKKLAKEEAKMNRGKKFVDAFIKTLGGEAVAAAASTTTTTATQIPRKAIGG